MRTCEPWRHVEWLRSDPRREELLLNRGGDHVDVFDLDGFLVSDYERFARSFTQIRSADIRDQVDDLYAVRRFWPDTLVKLHHHFERGDEVAAFAADA